LPRLKAAALAGILLLAVVAFFLHLLEPIDDPDVFWHLKTGEWIAANRALPTTDPFAYTTAAPVTSDQRFVLTSYWLSQLVLQALCSLAGLQGVVILRFALAGLIVAVMAFRREGEVALGAGLMAVLAGILAIYPLERPQTWSFVFFAALLGLLDAVRKGGVGGVPARGAAAAVPVLMLVWANTHAGALPGQSVMLLVLALETARRVISGGDREAWGRLRLLALSSAAGLATSMINPNGWRAVAFTRLFFENSSRNQEMWSSFEAFRAFGTAAAPALWFLVLFTVVSLALDWRRIDLVDAVLLAAVGTVSLAHIRYMAYFPLAALPLAARHASRSRFAKPLAAVALVAGTAVCGELLGQEVADIAFLSPTGQINSFAFPSAAADFIEREEPARNLYNDVNWGGYLIWRLGPAWQVFVDNRISGPEILAEAVAVGTAAPQDDDGRPRWQAILARRGVGCVLTPVYSNLGVAYPLIAALLSDREWVPVFLGLNETVFVRRTLENMRIIRRWALPRREFVARLLDTLDTIAAARPGDPAPRIAKGDVLAGLSRPEDARREYEAALRLAPLHPVAGQRLGVTSRR